METRTIDAALLDRFRGALRSLPTLPRAIFSLHAVHDLSFREIARRLSLDVVCVEAELARALVLLDEALSTPDPGVAPNCLGSDPDASLDTP